MSSSQQSNQLQQQPPPTSASGVSAAAVAASGGTAVSSSGGGGATAPSKANAATITKKLELTDQAVLDYLKSKGLGNAAIELQNLLSSDGGDGGDGANTTTTASTSKVGSGSAANENKSIRERLEEEDATTRNSRSLLSKSTGGGYGYDRDAACPVAQWGVPDTGRQVALVENDNDDDDGQAKKDDNNNKDAMDIDDDNVNIGLGVAEARAYLDAFTSIQLWVLSLPDIDGRQVIDNPIKHAQALLLRKSHQTNNNIKTTAGSSGSPTKDTKDNNNNNTSLLPAVIQELAHKDPPQIGDTFFHLPPSSKPELLAVTFALLVHTYCELLEVGMESTAHLLRDAFRPVYESIYGQEYRDLYSCKSVEDMVRLNSHNSQHMEALSSLKSILVQVASYQLRREELHAQTVTMDKNQSENRQSIVAREAKIREYDRNISILKNKYSELSQRCSLAFAKMDGLPFLRRARAVRWQLTLSQTSYGLLASYLRDDNHLPMSTLLQNKCELHIEPREPLPFTPAIVLDVSFDEYEVGGDGTSNRGPIPALDLNKIDINWASPVALRDIKQAAAHGKLPFPKYHLDGEYDTQENADRARKQIEFNRALLINGFRRLEALERKRDYESMSSTARKQLQLGGDTTNKPSSSCTTAAEGSGEVPAVAANPLEPTILLTTLCSSSAAAAAAAAVTPVAQRPKASSRGGSSSAAASMAEHIASIWQEPGIGLCCARLSPPDGRRVAVGCDDSAIRIWDVMDSANDAAAAAAASSSTNSGSGMESKKQKQLSPNNCSEPCTILLGHKNGFPVFDVDWNRDGRCLLSAGGDGSIRLWDTLAVGPFGDVVPLQPKKEKQLTSKPGSAKATGSSAKGPSSGAAAGTTAVASNQVSSLSSSGGGVMNVPGWRAEDLVPYTSGAALAVYRGHTPGSPVWSCKFAPCGYYFLSGGGDATARLWVTDRATPVRLFCGHTSSNVNCVNWHPNCNYAVTGSDDKTCRLWDIQTGRTVRLLTGCHSGVNVVEISPGGKYLAAGDYYGVVHLWDLGSGKKVNEFRTVTPLNNKQGNAAIHRLSFSACGSALATGGDDCSVKIWDVRSNVMNTYGYGGGGGTASSLSFINTPVKTFQTRQTLLMDLSFTKRNLLLSVGKFVTPNIAQ